MAFFAREEVIGVTAEFAGLCCSRESGARRMSASRS